MEERIVIFRTGQLFEIDMAANYLKEAGIPYFTQEQLSSGITFAMPASPSTGPGVFWNLLVPKAWEERAKEKLKNLPFADKMNPTVWDFQPTERTKLGWKVYCLIILALLAIGWLGNIFVFVRWFFQ